ncbi:MAG: CHAT domain-containing protein [Scytonema hyalinum WJT4-NPBG1]|jgi:hypothetical protein|nr:CHAT domain-containing protein [Scytonema hyalinum WJT4-NPBG1]
MNDSPVLKSILLLAANPKGIKSLRLQEEERDIRERLRLAGYGKIPINSTGATRPRDIQQAMLDFKPQIVHFSGHGAGQDGLVFEDATGQEKLVSSEALASLFKLFSNRVECVVLNACYSQFQAEAIAQNIEYVIGMGQAIGDRAAIEFAVGFYTALASEESIEFAYMLGCNAIQLEGIPEHLTPVLFKRGKLILSRLDNNNSLEQDEAKRLEFDTLVAALRLDHLETEGMLELLARKFEQALPHNTTVNRNISLLSNKRSIQKITLQLDKHNYEISRQSSGIFKARIMKLVRGIVIKTNEVSVHEWIGEIVHELIRLAAQSEDIRLALDNFLAS